MYHCIPNSWGKIGKAMYINQHVCLNIIIIYLYIIRIYLFIIKIYLFISREKEREIIIIIGCNVSSSFNLL